VDNVTLEKQGKEEKSYSPCPICGEMLLVEIPKNQKPYCTCNECGIQLFIRGKSGIDRFKNLLGKAGLRDSSLDLVRTIDYFNYLRKKLEELQAEKPFFGTDENLELEERIVQNQLVHIRNYLKETIA